MDLQGTSSRCDVAVVGAGMAGLTCAQQLHQAGYRVVVLEKSRGVGGRVATRRVQNTYADHGTCYLKPQGKLLQLVRVLSDRDLLHVWTDVTYELDAADLVPQLVEAERYPRYVAAAGLNAIAKFLATGLEIWRNQRVNALSLAPQKSWQLTSDATTEGSNVLSAEAIVIAIPAPQARLLLEPLATQFPAPFLETLQTVDYHPSLSVIARYPEARQRDWEKLTPAWKACTLHNCDLAWIGLDSSKHLDSQAPVFVLQSSAEFAQRYLDSDDLTPAAHTLLASAAQYLIPWLDTPDWFQVHRWRYAFPKRPLPQDYLATTTPLPLVCCGDWCGGNLVDSALNSGLEAAVQVNEQLRQLPLGETFLDVR